jgi:hypothetical protein
MLDGNAAKNEIVIASEAKQSIGCTLWIASSRPPSLVELADRSLLAMAIIPYLTKNFKHGNILLQTRNRHDRQQKTP